ncbi:MAG: outer membrane lipoprotein-sorting protein, partial [Thermodesulfobacteriota bacterium]
STRKWEDETHKMVGEKKFGGYTAEYDGKTYSKDTDCYVLEAVPQRKEWYYSKRVVWLDKRFAGLVFDEVYDPAGRKWKTFVKDYATWENGCLPQIFLEGKDLLSGHMSAIGFKEENIKFNTNQKEGFFSERTLMRSKW